MAVQSCVGSSGVAEPGGTAPPTPVVASGSDAHTLIESESEGGLAPRPTGTSPEGGAPRRFLVPEAEHVSSAKYRCAGRRLEHAQERKLDAMIRTLSHTAPTSPGNPVFIGLRTCGHYRALTVANRYERHKLIYDASGDLVAAFHSIDVVDAACGKDPESATIHYGQHVDCSETNLLFPGP